MIDGRATEQSFELVSAFGDGESSFEVLPSYGGVTVSSFDIVSVLEGDRGYRGTHSHRSHSSCSAALNVWWSASLHLSNTRSRIPKLSRCHQLFDQDMSFSLPSLFLSSPLSFLSPVSPSLANMAGTASRNTGTSTKVSHGIREIVNCLRHWRLGEKQHRPQQQQQRHLASPCPLAQSVHGSSLKCSSCAISHRVKTRRIRRPPCAGLCTRGSFTKQ